MYLRGPHKDDAGGGHRTASQSLLRQGDPTPLISGRVAIALRAQKMQTSTRKLSTTTSFAAATSWWDKAFPAPKTRPGSSLARQLRAGLLSTTSSRAGNEVGAGFMAGRRKGDGGRAHGSFAQQCNALSRRGLGWRSHGAPAAGLVCLEGRAAHDGTRPRATVPCSADVRDQRERRRQRGSNRGLGGRGGRQGRGREPC